VSCYWDNSGHDYEECYEEYEDCIEELPSDLHDVCEEIKNDCLQACAPSWTGDGSLGDEGEGTTGAATSGTSNDDGDETGCPREPGSRCTGSEATTGGATSADTQGTTAGTSGSSSSTESSGTSGAETGTAMDGSGSATDEPTGTGDDAGESSEGEDASTGSDVNPACFELHLTCVQQATTVAEVEACEALFDQCALAQPCEEECEVVCPDPVLQGCLDAYVGCASGASTVAQEEICAASFDVCAVDVEDDLCLPPYEPEALDPCLEQHALCVECIEDTEDLYLCREVFQACVEGTAAPA